MKQISVRRRVTFWYAVFMTLIVFLALFSQYQVGIRTMRTHYREVLENTAENASEGIRFRNGLPEVSSTFAIRSGTRVVLYNERDELLYGFHLVDAPFVKDAFRAAPDREGDTWYIRDAELMLNGETYRLRCLVQALPENILEFINFEMAGMMLITVVLASVGGYLITKRAFVPVKELAVTAESIADGRDLKLRVPMRETRDELQLLTQVFNDMLGRLEEAFSREHRFTSDASHEMRTPIAAILTQAEFAISEYADDEDRKDALVDIHARAGQLSDLINRLLSISRMDSGRQQLMPEQVDLTEISAVTAEMFADQAKEKNMTLSCSAPGPAVLVGDRTLLTQAMTNLIGNAVKYADPGGEIRVRVETDGRKVRAIVEDDGPGIAAEDLSHIFERFYQADPSHHSTGAGLGLPLVQLIARLHGGDVRAESTPGTGSRFSIELPVKNTGTEE